MATRKKARKKTTARKGGNIFKKAAQDKSYKSAKKKAREYARKAASAYKSAVKKLKGKRKK